MKSYLNNPLTPRENFLMSLFNKLIKEYKALIEFMRNTKPFKIIEILSLSDVPGETKFKIQISNKSSTLNLKAAEIIYRGYNLDNFSEFHAEMIKRAAMGNLSEYLSISEEPLSKIISKSFDGEKKEHIFTIEMQEKKIARTAQEISKNKKLLLSMQNKDVFDIGFTQGVESILKEQRALKFLKKDSPGH